jgi:hypothetical protein
MLRVTSGGANEIAFFDTPVRRTDGAACGRPFLAAARNRFTGSRLMLPFSDQRTTISSTLTALRDPDPSVATALKTLGGTDGLFSFGSFADNSREVAFGDGSVRFIVDGFGAGILEAMQVGANGENWRSLPAVQMPSLRVTTTPRRTARSPTSYRLYRRSAIPTSRRCSWAR